jgi:hypothetical protein
MLVSGRSDKARRPPEFPASPESLLGWTERRVLAALGRPASHTDGRCWFSEQFGQEIVVEMDVGGRMRPAVMSDPAPHTLRPGFPHRVWIYRGVRGCTWFVFFANPAGRIGGKPLMSGPRQVVDVSCKQE